MLACDWEDVRPDILILGKSLSGGIIPISAVLCDDEVMLTIGPGEHGSTYGGNPLACKIAIEAIKVIIEENMIQNALEMGILFRNGLKSIELENGITVRGKGLLNAIEINLRNVKAKDICYMLMKEGLLAKPTRDKIIRLSPPLCITKAQIKESIEIIKHVILKIT